VWLTKRTKEELEHWLRRCDIPLLASMPDGSILWCNPAFEDLLGYTSAELEHMSWVDLTDAKSDREADIQMAREVAAGTRDSYNLEKKYRTKHGPAKTVRIHVLRNPFAGDFYCYFVSCTPLDVGYDVALARMEEMTIALAAQGSQISDLTRTIVEKGDIWRRYWKWVAANKWLGIPATITIATMLFGERLLEVIAAAVKITTGALTGNATP
jgi:PAS domain S-box-containing protein